MQTNEQKLDLLNMETDHMGIFCCFGKHKKVINVLRCMYIMDISIMVFEAMTSILLNRILFPETMKNIAFLFVYPLSFIPFIIIQSVNLANLKTIETSPKHFIINVEKV